MCLRQGRSEGREAVDVVANGVEERPSPPACPVCLADSAYERARRVRSGVVVAGRRERQADDVDVRERLVEHLVAARQQRLVGDRCGRCAVPSKLRRPEEALVRLIPDNHVADRRKPRERITDVGAVLAAGDIRLRRIAEVVHRQHNLQPRRVTDGVLEVDDVAVRDARLPLRPLEREPERFRAELARRGDRRLTNRPRHILAEPDEETPAVERGLRIGGTEQQRRCHCGGQDELQDPGTP
jgi:hypothetical protein